MAHAGYGPLLPGSFALPAPYAYRCPIRHCDGACDCTCLDAGFELVDQQSVGSLAAAIAEPVLSTGGIIVPPDGYFARLAEHCARRGMLLVLDEAQTCLGRLGTMFAFERDGVVPDLLSLSKTLGGGLPLAATVTSAAIAEDCERKGFLHVTSHVSDPLPAAAGPGRAGRDRGGGARRRAAASGRVPARRGCGSCRTRHEQIGDVRGRGLLVGLELVDGPGVEGARGRAGPRGHGRVPGARPVDEHRAVRGDRELLPPRAAADRDRGRDRRGRRDPGRVDRGGARGPRCRRRLRADGRGARAADRGARRDRLGQPVARRGRGGGDRDRSLRGLVDGGGTARRGGARAGGRPAERRRRRAGDRRRPLADAERAPGHGRHGGHGGAVLGPRRGRQAVRARRAGHEGQPGGDHARRARGGGAGAARRRGRGRGRGRGGG